MIRITRETRTVPVSFPRFYSTLGSQKIITISDCKTGHTLQYSMYRRGETKRVLKSGSADFADLMTLYVDLVTAGHVTAALNFRINSLALVTNSPPPPLFTPTTPLN